MKKKIVSVILCGMMSLSLLGGCGEKKGDDGRGSGDDSKITLNYWTWFPSAEMLQPVIDSYEKTHPGVHIEVTVMDSQAYQQKLPIALSTEEDIDLCGVQMGAMADQMKKYLTPLEPLLNQGTSDWEKMYNQEDAKALKEMTDGELKFLTMVKVGSMVGYYNESVFEELNLDVPKTIGEMKTVVDDIRSKKPEMLPVAVAGKDAWFQDELMETVLTQQGDYYNQWRYEEAPFDSPEYIKALTDYKKFYDLGIFTKDVMDLDYASASDKFYSGEAAMYFQGTWDAGILSEEYRKTVGADISSVSAFAMPVVDSSGKASIRSYYEDGVAITESCENKKEAAEFLAYLVYGEGMQKLGQNFIGIPSKTDFVLDEGKLVTDAEKEGYRLISELTLNPGADRNNISSFSDIVGAGVQRVILGETTPEEEAKALQKEWESGKYH